MSRPALDPTHSPIHWVPVDPSGLMRPGCETDYSPPSNPDVKCAWIYTATLLYASTSHTYTALRVFNAVNREIQM